MKCHQTRLEKNWFVCGKCFGICSGKLEVRLPDKPKIDVCDKCNGVYRPI